MSSSTEIILQKSAFWKNYVSFGVPLFNFFFVFCQLDDFLKHKLQ